MDRRKVLGVLGSVFIGGCVDRRPPSTQSSSSSPSPTETVETTPSTEPAFSDGTATSVSTTDCEPVKVGEFVLWNDDDSQHTVTLTVENNSDVLLNETHTLSAGADIEVENPIDQPGVFRVTTSLKNEKEAVSSWDVTCGSTEYRQIFISEDGDVTIRQMQRTVTG